MFLFLLSTCLFVSPIFVVGIEYACRCEQRTFVVKDSNWSVVVRLAVCLAAHHGPHVRHHCQIATYCNNFVS